MHVLKENFCSFSYIYEKMINVHCLSAQNNRVNVKLLATLCFIFNIFRIKFFYKKVIKIIYDNNTYIYIF